MDWIFSGGVAGDEQQQPVVQQVEDNQQFEPGILSNVIEHRGVPPPVPPSRPTYEQIVIDDPEEELAQAQRDTEEGEVEMTADLEEKDGLIFENKSLVKRSELFPPIIIPTKLNQLENYLNPFLLIIQQIAKIKQLVYQHEFESIGFDIDWFNKDVIETDEANKDVKFYLELQRIFGFLEGTSKRWFASPNLLLNSLPLNDFTKIDSLNDQYLFFFYLLNDNLKKLKIINNEEEDNTFNDFYKHQVRSTFDEITSYGVLECENDDIQNNLFKTLSGIIWGDELSAPQTLEHVADIFTIAIEPSEESISSGLELDEIFYPNVFSTAYKETIKNIDHKISTIRVEKAKVSESLRNLKVYQGKNLLTSINTTLKFLSFELADSPEDLSLKSAVSDIESVEKELLAKREELINRQSELELELNNYKLKDCESVLSKSDQEPIPYKLTCAIISPYEFFYLKKSNELIPTEHWYHVLTDPSDFNGIEVKKTNFKQVKRAVFAVSGLKQLDNPVVLFYVKESTWNEDLSLKVPDSVQEFLKKDLETVENSDSVAVSVSEETVDLLDSDVLTTEEVETTTISANNPFKETD